MSGFKRLKWDIEEFWQIFIKLLYKELDMQEFSLGLLG
jgi:hypothetical protein